MPKILVVGGAGYVGSTTCAWLLDHGHEVWVLDDLSTGHREAVLGYGFVQARAGDRAAVTQLLRQRQFDGVMHFAAKSLVAESVEKPDLYRENNVDQTRLLLESMLECGVRNLVFSSTCAIFGDPVASHRRIHEDLPKQPKSPYGETKLEVERMLADYAGRGLRSVALRYFNACGAEPWLRVGEWHEPETHLIPRVLRNAAAGLPADLFGTDYATPDGTCIRDYIHVWDLAAAHGAAMRRLLEKQAIEVEKGSFEAFNLGSESGYSVREVIDACESVIGSAIARVQRERRPGDPPALVADSSRAKRVLGFDPKSSELPSIVRSAWEWEKKRTRAQAGVKAVFLDRDGTINEDPGYLSDPDKLKLLPGVEESLARLRKAGFRLVVVSNQSGVGRGLIPDGALDRVHSKLDQLLAIFGAKIDHYEFCVHRPEDGCECRKPKPKLILDAATKLGVDLRKSYMVGDKASDILAGLRAGCLGSVLVRTGEGRSVDATGAAYSAESLVEAADWILNQG